MSTSKSMSDEINRVGFELTLRGKVEPLAEESSTDKAEKEQPTNSIGIQQYLASADGR